MNHEFREQRLIAQTVPCTYCGAKQLEQCTRHNIDNKPLKNLPAHYRRIRDAEQGIPF